MNVQRLQRRIDYDRVFQRGFRLRGPFFLMLAHENRSRCHKLGIVVSRKIGCAVERNRARRLLREAFRRSVEENLVQPHDFVFVVRPEIKKAEYHGLEEECRRRLAALSRREKRFVGEDPALFD